MTDPLHDTHNASTAGSLPDATYGRETDAQSIESVRDISGNPARVHTLLKLGKHEEGCALLSSLELDDAEEFSRATVSYGEEYAYKIDKILQDTIAAKTAELERLQKPASANDSLTLSHTMLRNEASLIEGIREFVQIYDSQTTSDFLSGTADRANPISKQAITTDLLKRLRVLATEEKRLSEIYKEGNSQPLLLISSVSTAAIEPRHSYYSRERTEALDKVVDKAVDELRLILEFSELKNVDTENVQRISNQATRIESKALSKVLDQAIKKLSNYEKPRCSITYQAEIERLIERAEPLHKSVQQLKDASQQRAEFRQIFTDGRTRRLALLERLKIQRLEEETKAREEDQRLEREALRIREAELALEKRNQNLSRYCSEFSVHPLAWIEGHAADPELPSADELVTKLSWKQLFTLDSAVEHHLQEYQGFWNTFKRRNHQYTYKALSKLRVEIPKQIPRLLGSGENADLIAGAVLLAKQSRVEANIEQAAEAAGVTGLKTKAEISYPARLLRKGSPRDAIEFVSRQAEQYETMQKYLSS